MTDPGNKLIEMLHAQRKRADTNSDRPGRLMNRNAARKGRTPAVTDLGDKTLAVTDLGDK